MSTTFGVPGYTLELWDPFGFAEVENEKPVDFFMRPDAKKIAQVIAAFSKLDGAVSPWTAFDHPQLGPVEIGGMDYMRTIRNPPTHLLSDECRHGFVVADQLRRSLPQTQFKVTLTTLAPSLTRIEAYFENVGFLSTASSERAKHLAGTPTVNTALSLEGSLILSQGLTKWSCLISKAGALSTHKGHFSLSKPL